jgi:hypothetical protein
MRIYSQLEKEIIKGLIAIYNKKGSVLLTELLTPEKIKAEFPSLAATGKWAIIYLSSPDRLKVDIPKEYFTKANEDKIDCVRATVQNTVCTIASLIKHLRDDVLIISNSPPEFETSIGWIGSFEPPVGVGGNSNDPRFLDDLMPEIKEGFINNIHRPINYISQTLIEFAKNDFQTREEITMRKTVKATGILALCTLASSSIGALVAFLLQKLI